MARKMLIKALPESWGGHIQQAGNGVEALAQCRENKPDVVFLDLTMPEMDGFQVLETLKDEGIAPAIFVVSADIQPIAQERVLSLGAKAFVRKPVKSDELQAALKAQGLL
ncbi:CheY-like chemotaxis protein [Chitinivorax tropicus]|uniref:CheY-like chemotaxis protein n=2 Tax=Chitinivorax tropicus TaxID=714531 RepID=A0A840MGZ1_9PROT|nr:CheY-like chemotaxis protein [Chitinivorax tropicus]